jgi:hypothetical protein
MRRREKHSGGTPLLLTFLLSAVNTEEEKDMMRTKNKNTADSFLTAIATGSL